MFEIMVALILFDHVFNLSLAYNFCSFSLEFTKFEFILM